jgi:hypothetical protein
MNDVLGWVRVSFRGLIGLTDPCSRQEDFASLSFYKVLLSGLDLSHCVKGGVVSNSPLDLKQSSFTHTVQVSGRHTLVNGFPVHPFSGMLFSRSDFSFR